MVYLITALICSGMVEAVEIPVVKSLIRPDLSSQNLLSNPGFEEISDGIPRGWRPYRDGFKPDDRENHSGETSIRCKGRSGALQTIELDQEEPRPIFISGWSKAESVSGSPDSNYSLYVDIIYSDGTPLWGQTVNFSTGTHDWEYRERFILPEKPIKRLSFHALFRGHDGTVWFDDLRLVELSPSSEAFWFDGEFVRIEKTGLSESPHIFEVTTGDGLRLALRGDGRLAEVSCGERKLFEGSWPWIYARDFAANSDFIAAVGKVEKGENGGLTFTGEFPSLNLRIELDITFFKSHLRLDSKVKDLTGEDRAISLYIALPVAEEGWRWWDYVRRAKEIERENEYSNAVYCGAGATGYISLYPIGCVEDGRSSVVMGIPMDRPRLYRIACNGGSGELYIAFDFGLIPDSIRYPSSADFSLVIYRADPEWGFRSALKRYYEIFPEFFVKRVEKEGIWMPFTDISTVEGYEDFGFAFHEGTNNVKFDDQIGVYSFRYTEPMTYWQRMPKEVPRTYEAAVDFLKKNMRSQDRRLRDISRATELCGAYDRDGRYVLRIEDRPWCDGAVFTLNPNPDIPEDEFHTVNKAHLNYTPQMGDRLYSGENGQLDGEYLDSLEGWGSDRNFRREHFRYVSVPLTFDPQTKRPVILQIFSTYEFTRYISDDIHRRGRLMMANAVPWRFGFLGHLLDVMGTEVNWMQGDKLVPESDERMSYRRAICYRKPYLLLMNTFYDKFTPDKVEVYMKRCLFYGIFPSMFSHNAAENPYWRNPKWYNRDRHLFKRYIPLIRLIAQAGWEPVTGVRGDNSFVYIERYGDFEDEFLYLTLLNPTDERQGIELSLPMRVKEVDELIEGEALVSSPADKVSVEIMPGDVRLLRLRF
jgi:hypothetical protein